MSTRERRQRTHMLAGLGGIATPQMQHRTVPTVCAGMNMPDCSISIGGLDIEEEEEIRVGGDGRWKSKKKSEIRVGGTAAW